MAGKGPFLWLSKEAPPHGYRELPESGMCVSAFVLLHRGDEILLGRYREDARWEEMAGLDPERQRVHGRGWTVPASQLKFGEEPRAAGRRVVEDILRIPGLRLSEPVVESDHYVPKRFPELGMHYDLWLLFGAEVPAGRQVAAPPWYWELRFVDPRSLRPEDYARGHEDVVERWLSRRARPADGG